jgi:ABC-type transport system involved in multi-copper enzyme maturation permease subunit
MQISQIIGMAVYEFRMHWRRRTLQVATLSLIGLSLIIMLVLGSSMEQYLQQFGNMDPNAPLNIVPFFWIPIYFVILVLYGPMMSEVIPLDHNVGVRELLESLPLKHETYLAGKLLGMLLALLSGLVIAALVVGAAAWVVFGGFEIAPYVQMWLVGVFPLVLLNPGLSLLLAAGQPTRRRAAAIGGGLAIICMALFATSTMNILNGESNALLDSMNPARPAILRYFLPAASNGAMVSTVSSSAGGEVALAVVVGLLELLVAGAVIWWWLRWRESRA